MLPFMQGFLVGEVGAELTIYSYLPDKKTPQHFVFYHQSSTE